MVITFDTIDHGAKAEFSAESVSVIRTGVIEQIEASTTADPYVLLRGVEAFLNNATQGYPGLERALLRSLIIAPTNATDAVTFAATYEWIRKEPGSGVRWFVEDNSTLTSEQEELDLEGKPIQVHFASTEGVDNPGSASENNTARVTTPLSPLRPRRTLSVRGYIIGRPGEGVLDAHDTVNDRKWMGKPRGYWLCTEAGASIEHRAADPFDPRVRMYKVSARWMTKVRRDWSHYIIYRNHFGKIPRELTTDDFGNKIRAKLLEPYQPKQERINGFTRVGMYHMSDFEGIFGFGEKDIPSPAAELAAKGNVKDTVFGKH